ncbi:MAG TPA: SusC/RagA family TonB-linked outer membrane protein [Prolixibacteraceae bacterium]|nr:SusC/RagA family TonB-linked outer membrane protein [Prolixibacteraceae bacterium]
MNYLLKILIAIGFIAIQPDVSAQETASSGIRVSGEVFSVLTGKPVELALVNCGDFSSTFTDEKGEFTIEARSPDDIISVSAQGYHPKDILLSGRSRVSVYLSGEETHSFQEQAWFGYFSKKQIYTTQSVVSVRNTVAESAKSGIGSGEAVFDGRVAGLEARARNGIKGAGSDLFLRGYSSLYGNNQPLVIVDGMIFNTQSYGTSLIDGYRSNPLASIAEYDIENVTLVRDAASIYGAKASNGVVFIRTSKATQQATVIDLIMNGNYEMAPDNIPMLEAGQYRTYLNEILLSKGLTADSINRMPFMNTDPSVPGYYKYQNNTDWQKKVFADNYSSNVGLRIKGGDDVALYALSVGFSQQKGTVKGSDNSRFNFRFNSDINFSQKVTLNSNISFNYIKKNITATNIFSYYDAVAQARVKAPFLQEFIQNDQGVASPDLTNYDFLSVSNPVSLIENGQNEDMNNLLFASLNFNWDLARNLTLSNLVGMSVDKQRQSVFIPRAGIAPDSTDAGVIENQMKARVLRHFVINNDIRIKYEPRLGVNHSLMLLAGARLNVNTLEEDWGADYNSANDQIRSLGNGNYLLRQKGGTIGDWSSLVWYLHSDYGLKNKYLFTLNLGLDGSSRYGSKADGIPMFGTRFCFYPGMAAAWIISAEPFLAGSRIVELLKLRASWGLTGNDDIGNYTAQKYYVAKNLLGYQGTMMGNLWNPALGAERNSRINAGLDMSFFRERISASVDIFRNKTSRMFDYVTANILTGFYGYYDNRGGFTTNGIDAMVRARVANRPLEWDLGIVLSKYATKVDDLFDQKRITPVFGANILTEEGRPLGLFYGYATRGVFAGDAEALQSGLSNRMANESLVPFRGGDVIFEDFHPDGIIDENDMQVIGDPAPDLTGEIFTELHFKRISLQASLGFSVGNDVFNYLRYTLENMSTTNNQTTAVVNRWRYQGQATEIPRAAYGDPMQNSRFSDRWIEDGSYARLKRVSLTYRLPVRSKWVHSADLFATGINLLTFTKYLGLDPEFSLNGFALSQGIDVGMIPQNEMVLLGVKLGL